MTAPSTPVAAGAFAISSEPREDQPRPVPHDSAGGAEGHPELADLCGPGAADTGCSWSVAWLGAGQLALLRRLK
jgi:hypothetical protein